MSSEARLAAMRRRDPLPEPGPQHVVVDLTNRCNSNCIACWTGSPLLRGQAPAPEWFSRQLPTPVVHELLRDLAGMGCEIVRFTGGGEPLLHPHLEELVQAASTLGLGCHVTSNGTLLDRLTAPALAAIGELTVSLWAATPATYSRLHPNKTGATFERIIATLDEIRHDRERFVYC
jgi:MoaA/NifB/PqqE/SkfB family radical SAM enzyme